VDVFIALADPTRRKVLELLRVRAHTAGELLDACADLSQPAMSRHLRILREVGLVSVRPDEQRRIYALRPEGFTELGAWIARYQPFWQDRLDALEQHLATFYHTDTPHDTERSTPND
jgi:DNA-binding transcriptional ArsR family regulator